MLPSLSGSQVAPTSPGFAGRGVCRPGPWVHPAAVGWKAPTMRALLISSVAPSTALERMCMLWGETFPEGCSGNSMLERGCWAEVPIQSIAMVLETAAKARTVMAMWTSCKTGATAKGWQNGTRTLWKQFQEKVIACFSSVGPFCSSAVLRFLFFYSNHCVLWKCLGSFECHHRTI